MTWECGCHCQTNKLSSLVIVLLSMVLMLTTLVIPGCCENDVSSNDASIKETTAEVYLETFGYYGTHNAAPPQDDLGMVGGDHLQSHSIQDRERAIKRMQSFFHLPVTGNIDAETSRVMKTPRCGVRDVYGEQDEEGLEEKEEEEEGKEEEKVEQQEDRVLGEIGAKLPRKKRYTVSRYQDGRINRWVTDRLTWGITKPSRQLPVQRQREIIRKSLAEWAKVVPVKFVEETGRDEPDINIQFARGKHGPHPDPVFDGRKDDLNKLAHAWGPGPKGKGFAGDVHFDEDDEWTNPDRMLGVAVHELGHAMGLGHSKELTAVMYPTYRDVFHLSEDDIRGIRLMYSSKPIVRPSTKKPSGRYRTRRPDPGVTDTYPVIPSTAPTCQHLQVDAVFKDPAVTVTELYCVTSGENLHNIASNGQVLSTVALNDIFPGAPAHADAAFSIQERNRVYFIKDNQVWSYHNRQLEPDYPRSLHNARFPERPNYSVTVKNNNGKTKVLLFGRRFWWTYDVDGQIPPVRRSILEFGRSLTRDVMFATQWTDNVVYVIKSDSYVILDTEGRKVTEGFPKAEKPDWLRFLCGNGSSRSLSSWMTVVMATLITLCYFLERIV